VLGFQAGSLQRTLWSALTYMFVHYGVWHLALNMYVLLAFGPRLEAAMGTRAFTLYYLWCGLGGAVAHMLFVHTGLLVGASAGALGVMFAYWQQWPDEEISLFGVVSMRPWTMLMLLGGAILISGAFGAGATVAGGERIAYVAHVGGIAFAWLYMRTPPAASIERFRQRISPAPDYPQDETPRAIVVDPQDNIYVTGRALVGYDHHLGMLRQLVVEAGHALDVGAGALDAFEHHDVAFRSGLESGTQQTNVFPRLGDHVIRRKDSHQSIGIDRLQNMRGEPDGGSGVALRRLGQNLALGNLRQLLHDLGTQLGAGENP